MNFDNIKMNAYFVQYREKKLVFNNSLITQRQ